MDVDYMLMEIKRELDKLRDGSNRAMVALGRPDEQWTMADSRYDIDIYRDAFDRERNTATVVVLERDYPRWNVIRRTTIDARSDASMVAMGIFNYI